ncbi:hypothetical protein CASFOL_031601 [Castilleja foliolosa]|uniref:Eukaryotic translation initiation factor 3 30 kDa subunit n=1 Tax=Castilleja foliolosa TaxID=1961234 RepID=A0ABD3C614_9LAMI
MTISPLPFHLANKPSFIRAEQPLAPDLSAERGGATSRRPDIVFVVNPRDFQLRMAASCCSTALFPLPRARTRYGVVSSGSVSQTQLSYRFGLSFRTRRPAEARKSDLINSPNFVSAYYNHHILSQEDEPVPGLLKKDNKRKSNWDDEDLDDNDMKDSSEEEEEDEPAPEPKTEPMPTEKAPKKTAAKTVEKKHKRFEALKEAPLDPVEEKLCQQRLVGEADYKYTAELFGKMGDEKTLDDFIPKSESDFTEYAELVVHKLRPYEKSYHYIELLKAVMRLVSLKDSDAKDVGLYITAILNETIKVEKEANAGKKKTEDEPVPSLLKKDYNLNSNWNVEDLDDNDDSWEEEDESAGKKREDEPVPSLLNKDYNLNSNWDVEELEDNDVKYSWEHKRNSNWDVGDLDDNDVKDSWEEEDASAGKKREDEPVPSLLKKDYKLKSNWDDEDLDDNDVKDSSEEVLKDRHSNLCHLSWGSGIVFQLRTADTNGVLFDDPRATYETELKDSVKKSFQQPEPSIVGSLKNIKIGDEVTKAARGMDDEYNWIVGKILRCFYDKDFRSDTMEPILSLSLFPTDFSIKDKSKKWVRIFSVFDKVVKALEKILEQKQRFVYTTCFKIRGQTCMHCVPFGVRIMKRLASNLDELQDSSAPVALPPVLYKPLEKKEENDSLVGEQKTWLADEDILAHIESLELEANGIDVVMKDSETEGQGS